MGDYDTYRKRHLRSVKLEELLFISRAMMDAVNQKDSETMTVLYSKLILKIGEIERLPSPDISLTQN